jgi:hypothetical protein
LHFEIVTEEIEVLVESLLAAKWPIALAAFEEVSRGVEVVQTSHSYN